MLLSSWNENIYYMRYFVCIWVWHLQNRLSLIWNLMGCKWFSEFQGEKTAHDAALGEVLLDKAFQVLLLWTTAKNNIFFKKKSKHTFQDVQIEVGSGKCWLLCVTQRPQAARLWPLSQLGGWRGSGGRKFGSALQSGPVWRIDETHQFVHAGSWTQLLLHVWPRWRVLKERTPALSVLLLLSSLTGQETQSVASEKDITESQFELNRNLTSCPGHVGPKRSQMKSEIFSQQSQAWSKAQRDRRGATFLTWARRPRTLVSVEPIQTVRRLTSLMLQCWATAESGSVSEVWGGLTVLSGEFLWLHTHFHTNSMNTSDMLECSSQKREKERLFLRFADADRFCLLCRLKSWHVS